MVLFLSVNATTTVIFFKYQYHSTTNDHGTFNKRNHVSDGSNTVVFTYTYCTKKYTYSHHGATMVNV